MIRHSYTLPPPSTAYPGPVVKPNPINPLRPVGGRHSDAIRMQALAIYAETGNQTEVERHLGIPQPTVNEWVNHTDTPQLLDDLRGTIRHRYGWDLVESVGKQMALVRKAQERGDPHVMRDGRIIYVPASLKDSTVSLSILIDKWMLISGSLSQSSAILSGLDSIHNSLKDLGLSLTGGSPSEAGMGETLGGGEKSQPPPSYDNNPHGLTLKDIGG